MNLLDKFSTLRLEPTESMFDYLTRAVYVSKHLELAVGKVSENIITSIVLRGLPSKYDYFKTVHEFLKDKASFAEVKKALAFSKVLLAYKLRQPAMKMLPCYSKELLRKVHRENLKSSMENVRVAVKVDINKPLVEYPSVTFAGVLAMKRMNVSKNSFLNPRSSAETGEPNLAEILLVFCDGSETALTSQKCEVKEHILGLDSGASSHIIFDRFLFFDFSGEAHRKVKNANKTFSLVEGVGNFSLLSS